MPILQSLVLPNLELPSDEALYLRLTGNAWAELARARVHLEAGDVLSTDTFHNGLTVGFWKRRCAIRTLALRLCGDGGFVVTVGHHQARAASRWHAESVVEVTPERPARIDLPCWSELGDGMLFVRIRALRTGVVTGAAFVTDDAPRRPVRLGMVITHFNRQAQARRAVQRIREQLLDRPGVGADLTLTVVDNSRNLEIEPHPGIRHLPSPNLGGTGGFTRGLLSLIDDGTHTHALFMDDDASCEPEAIARTLAALRHATSDRLAMAGALVREAAPWHLMEKGARFDGQVRELHRDLDLRHVPHLLAAETASERPDYGAWWFFAFPIAEVRHFPFPFFVRGDDIHFGLANDFDIATLNGVASLGEDFATKHGPMTAYLDARYHLVLALLAPAGGASRMYWVGSRLFVKALSSYLYDSARAVTLAMRHTLEGPEFFANNLDLQAVRSEIAAWRTNEKLVPIDRAGYRAKPARVGRESALRRLGRVLTLQGFLMPGWFVRDRMTVQDKAFHGRASQVFRYRRVLYECASTGTGFVAVYDRRRFFHELRAFVRVWASLFSRLPALRQAYAQGAAAMTSEDFWRGVHAQPRPVTAAVAPSGPAPARPAPRPLSAADASVAEP